MEDMRKDFGWFKKTVRSNGGIWASEHVRFTQFRDGYGATYRPSGCEHTTEDQAMTYNTDTGAWRNIPPHEYHERWEGNK